MPFDAQVIYFLTRTKFFGPLGLTGFIQPPTRFVALLSASSVLFSFKRPFWFLFLSQLHYTYYTTFKIVCQVESDQIRNKYNLKLHWNGVGRFLPLGASAPSIRPTWNRTAPRRELCGPGSTVNDPAAVDSVHAASYNAAMKTEATATATEPPTPAVAPRGRPAGRIHTARMDLRLPVELKRAVIVIAESVGLREADVVREALRHAVCDDDERERLIARLLDD